MRFSKQPEKDKGGLWKWIEGLLEKEESDSDHKKSSSDSDDENGEGGLMMPIPKGVDGVFPIRPNKPH